MKPKTVKTLIVLGSGGHTTEMLQICDKLNTSIYTPRYYIVANSDEITKQKLQALESEENRQGTIEIKEIIRSREVSQSYVTSVFTTLMAILSCIPLLWSFRPDLILCNGPGTCVPICLVAYGLRLVGRLRGCKIVYVESFCRVNSLSLSGKIVSRIADLFVVQWEDLLDANGKREYYGRLF